MLLSFKNIRGYVLQAADGEIGRCKDFLFEEATWTVRYMVVDTRKWLPGRKVLIAPAHLANPNWEQELLPVSLSRQQIKDAPGIDENAPISRRYEKRWADYFGYGRYWTSPMPSGPVGAAVGPTLPVDPTMSRQTPQPVTPLRDEEVADEDEVVRSCDEMLGYVVRATNGEFGHIQDVLIQSDGWKLKRWLIQSREMPKGQAAQGLVRTTRSINWHTRTIRLSQSREALAGARGASLSA